jgi:predicted transcriptional regulator
MVILTLLIQQQTENRVMTSITLGLVKRRTVSLTDEAAEALDRIAKAHSTTVSSVVEAAGTVLAEGGRLGEALEKRVGPDRRGGRREGSGRKRQTIEARPENRS